jgi:hypothetical protein
LSAAGETTTVKTGDIIIRPPKASDVAERMAPLVEQARAFAITDRDTHEEALAIIKTLRDAERDITADFEPTRKAVDEAKKQVLRLRDGYIAPIAAARLTIDTNARLYENAERARAENERRRLQDEARKQELARQEADALEAEAAGDTIGAQAIRAETVQVPVVSVATNTATVAGVVSREIWSAKVHLSSCTDDGCENLTHESDGLMQLAKHVVEHPEWVMLLLPNQVALNKMATTMHEKLSIPGVRAVSKQSRR